MITAKQFLKQRTFEENEEMLRQYGRMCVKEALKAAVKNAKVRDLSGPFSNKKKREYKIDASSVINSFPLSKIK